MESTHENRRRTGDWQRTPHIASALALAMLLLAAVVPAAAADDTGEGEPVPILYEIFLVETGEPIIGTTAAAVTGAARGELDELIDLPQATAAGASLAERLAAAEEAGALRILAAPRTLTQVGQLVRAQTGSQIPVQTMMNDSVTVQYVSATLGLDLRSRLSDDGLLTLSMSYKKRVPRFDLVQGKGGAPNAAIEIIEQDAVLVVRDGGTAVLAGVRTAFRDGAMERVPELVLLVTPKLVDL